MVFLSTHYIMNADDFMDDLSSADEYIIGYSSLAQPKKKVAGFALCATTKVGLY